MSYTRPCRTCPGAARLMAILLAICVTGIFLLLVPSINANGFTWPIAKGTSGPYEYQVGIWPPSPTVGNVHLAIAVTSNENPVTGAVITVTGRGSDGRVDAGPVSAFPYPLQPWSYELNMDLGEPGKWTLQIDIDSPLGRTSVIAPLDVAEPRSQEAGGQSPDSAQSSGGVNWTGVNWIIVGAPIGVLALVLAAWAFRRQVG